MKISLHLLVYKQMPELPVNGIVQSISVERYEELPKAVMEQLLVFWDKYFVEVGKKLREGDVAMVMAYFK